MDKNKSKYTLTQARQNFFHLIKLAENGKPVVIENAENGSQYMITKQQKPKKDLNAIAHRMGKIGAQINTPEQLKAILEDSPITHLK